MHEYRECGNLVTLRRERLKVSKIKRGSEISHEKCITGLIRINKSSFFYKLSSLLWRAKQK